MATRQCPTITPFPSLFQHHSEAFEASQPCRSALAIPKQLAQWSFTTIEAPLLLRQVVGSYLHLKCFPVNHHLFVAVNDELSVVLHAWLSLLQVPNQELPFP